MVMVRFVWNIITHVRTWWPCMIMSAYKSPKKQREQEEDTTEEEHDHSLAEESSSKVVGRKKRMSAFSIYQQQRKLREQKDTAEKERDHSVAEESSSKKAGKKRKSSVKKGAGLRKKRKLAVEATESGADVSPRRSKWKGKGKAGGKKKRKNKKAQAPVDNSESENEVDWSGMVEEYGSLETMASQGALDVPFHSQFDAEAYEDSRVAGRELFGLLISPFTVEKFYSDVWERRPMLLRRHKANYNDGWFSTEELDHILREHELEFTTNIDITTYEEGTRITHNPEGRAYASTVWEYFKDGCSVRLLNPQTFSRSMWLLNSTLQEHFNSCVGANVYLTPADSQGFAPHYDDIEAFVLQIEGKKRWKFYSPRDKEVLPRYSSPNFSQDEIGNAIMDVVLEAGDLLYFPRGTIHQATTLPDSHSLHITLSTYQKNTWGDLLEKLVPAALEVALSEDTEFRRGLPHNYLNYMGAIHSDINDPQRRRFVDTIAAMMVKLVQYAPIDSAVDQMGADHIHSCLPPCPTKSDQLGGVWTNGAQWKDGRVQEGIELTGATQVRLIRYGAVRLALEDEEPILYFTTSNSRVYHEKDIQGMAVLPEDAVAIERLIHSYPNFVSIDSLQAQIGLCRQLYSQGLLVVEQENTI